MSEEILKALMQLFAIVSRPGSEASERKQMVESFLVRQLNQELVAVYLDIFSVYFRQVMEEDAKVTKKERLLSRRSVRVLKICTVINEALAQPQKIVVLFQLLEFIKSDKLRASSQEMEFISTVSDTFNIPDEDFELIRNFVLSDGNLDDKTEYLVVDGRQEHGAGKQIKHICRENLIGQIYLIHINSSNLYFVKYAGQAELYMNGQLLEPYKTYPLNAGSSLRNQQIAPVYYSDIVSPFVGDMVKSRINFEARNITYRFKSGDVGLHNLSFGEQSGRLVGIMGASGAGKSTLLQVLNGTSIPSEGEVLINGINIHSGDPGIEGIIGFVSQDDLLIEELSVYQNLYYNAKLCFDNYTEEQLVETVHRVLVNLGLFEIKDFQVGSPLNKKISGGQRKRLNIALELIREPAVLFLDEPTSGLSSRDSENILDLLKELTFKGKLVFVVIHQPSSDIFKMFDRLLILDTGGYLIYNGNPVDSIMYFKSRVQAADWNESECPTCGNVNPEQVFNIVETSVLDEFGNLTHTRKISPKEWSKHFREKYKEVKLKQATKKDLPDISFRIPGKLKQFSVFFKRDVMKKLSDTQYLVINFLEAPLLAFLLAFIVRYFDSGVSGDPRYRLLDNDNLPVYIFMSVIVAIFMGLTVSAEEIIKDRKILKREAFLNLSRSSYLLSKVMVQFLLSAIQAFTFVMIGNTVLGIQGMYFEYWLVLFSSWSMANMMGLLISDSFKTVVTIYILIPFLVIPQIILSGIIVKYENLNPQISSPKRIPFYGEIIAARWAYEGLATYQFMNNEYQKRFYAWDKLKSTAGLKYNFHLKELLNKLKYIERNLNDPAAAEKIAYNLKSLRIEIHDELKERLIMHEYYEDTPAFTMKYVEQLSPETINEEILAYTREYLEALNSFYKKIYKAAGNKLEEITRSFNPDELQKLQQKHANRNLEEFVTNKKTFDYFIEHKGDMIQVRDPIYRDPTHRFIKAHFYSPRKMIAGTFIPTLWVNVMVIWFMTLFLYMMLYYRVLKKFLDYMERINQKNSY
ncbi:MAG: ATP-binding cassette domain-containing protein [Bacteroidales bacterium]|nr:ATP-binding cassette domain-containing protein [Bacteroidales bacterium]